MPYNVCQESLTSETRHRRRDDGDEQGRDTERHEGGEHADSERDHEAHPENWNTLQIAV